MPVFVGVDLGTSSIKFTVLNESFEEVYKASRGVEGGVFYNPEDALLIVKSELDIIASKFAGEVYVGFSGHSPSLVAMDEEGGSLESIIWLDNRAEPVVGDLAKLLDEREWYTRTGLRLSHIFFPAKIEWIKRFKPRVFEKARWFTQFKDYIVYNLSGETYTDYSSASETQLLNIRGVYDQEILGILGIDETRLFTPADSHMIVEYASNPRVKIALGGVDSVVAALGGGVVGGNTASLSAGSSACLDIPVDKPLLDYEKGFETYRHVVPGMYVLEASLPAAGLTVDKILELTSSERSLEDEIRLERGSGLVLIPYLAGSRSPDWDSSARGLLYGLSLATTPVELLKAAYEGVGLWVREALELASTMGLVVRELVVSGGLSSSRVFNTILSSIVGVEVKKPRVKDLSPYGAAVIAAIGSGGIDFKDAGRLVDYESVYKPVVELAGHYNRLYGIYRKLKNIYRSVKVLDE